jgi:hypothetical protein
MAKEGGAGVTCVSPLWRRSVKLSSMFLLNTIYAFDVYMADQLAIDFWLQTNDQVGPNFKHKKT